MEEARTKVRGGGTVHGQWKITRSLSVRAAGFQKGHQIKISRRESSGMGFIPGFSEMAPQGLLIIQSIPGVIPREPLADAII
jgi:hypothetical protein